MTRTNILLISVLGSMLVACGSNDGGTDGGNEGEVITTVALTFTPDNGGDAQSFEVNDADGDGGDPPVIDDISLAAGTYAVTVGFENRLEDPAEIITDEVRDESDQHQIFFTGTAVDGPATDNPGAALTHAYADTDVNGLPVGLANTIVTVDGTGNLTITLRHMPPVNDVAVKVDGVAAAVASGGFAAIGGSTDAQVTFPVTITTP